MMKILRKAAVYLMFGVLIVAFALWGVGDYVQQQRNQPLAKVGGVEITAQQFQQAYERTLSELGARARRRITPQEARTFGIPQQVLEELINEGALSAEARELGLGLSNEGLLNVIYRNESFVENGKFSRARYNQFLQEQGYQPVAFEQLLRTDLVRRQIRGVFDQGAVVPQVLVDAYNRYGNERRTLTYFNVTQETAGAIAAPTEQELRQYYENNKGQFTWPETRKVLFAAVTPDIVTGKIALSDGDIRATYDAKTSAYGEPERRKLEIIPFPTKAAADAAAAELAAGKDFLEIAKAAGFKQPEIDAGSVTKKELSDKSVYTQAAIDTAFATENGKTSAPVEGPLSTVIVRVLAVFPAREKTFDEVKDQIRADLLKTRVFDETSKLTKAFEDARTSGIPISETAKKLDVPVLTVTVDNRGNGPDGKPAATGGVPALTVAQAAFKSDVGVENEALRIAGGGNVWFEVLELEKSRQKSFDDVKVEAEASWRQGQVRVKVADKARELIGRLEAGEAIVEVAKSLNAEVKTSQPLKRRDNDPLIPAAAISQAFSLAQGGAASAAVGDGSSRIVFQISQITPPAALEGPATDSLRNRLSQAIAQDNLSSYVAGIKARLGETRNPRTANAIATGSVDAEDNR